jgi:hypothetical protein
MPETLGEAVDKRGVAAAFDAICNAFIQRGLAPVKDKVTGAAFGPWLVVVNGTQEPVSGKPSGTMGYKDLPPVHAALFYNGWLAGEINPAGGWIAAGECANEDTFISALSQNTGDRS